MYIIERMAITDTELTASNIAATAYPEWDISTTYALNDYVYVTGVTNKPYRLVYQSAQAGNLGNDPTADDGTNWTEIGATDRYKPFDDQVGESIANASTITYSITPSSFCDALGFFGLSAAEVRVQVQDDGAGEVINRYSDSDTGYNSTNQASVTAAAARDPTGALEANKLAMDSTAASSHYGVFTDTGITSGTEYTFSIHLKRAEMQYAQLVLPTAAFGSVLVAGFDLDGGTTVVSGGAASAITALDDGWYRCSITATATATTALYQQLRLADELSTTADTLDGDGASGIYFWGYQSEEGDEATAYQSITSGGGIKWYDRTNALVDNANVVDWFSYFYSDLEYANEAIFTDVPAYSGYQVDITISATSGNAEVSEIGIGKLVGVADSQDGTSLGIKDYSGVSRDIDGVATITERAYAKNVTFEVAFPTSEGARVKRILSRNRAKPVICFADTGIDGYGTITLGLIQDWDFPLGSGGMTFGSIEVEGMT